MSDIRKLNLAMRDAQNIVKHDNAEFELSDVQLATLQRVLPQLEAISYWSPEFEAWYPLVMAYLRSGVNPQMALTWSKRINSKIDKLGPKRGKFSRVFGEILYMSRTKDTEAFKDFFWAEIQEFLDWMQMPLQNEKLIYSTLKNEGFIRNELLGLLSYKQQDGLSPLFHEAVYLYRHSNAQDPANLTGVKAEVDKQAAIYVKRFEAAFEEAAMCCDSSRSVYSWYRPNIKALVSDAWLTSTDLGHKRLALTRDDVINLPVWLSESLTDYVSDMPSVCDLDVTTQFAFDALQSILSPHSSISDNSTLYAYILPRETIKNVLDKLNTFFWDVRQGLFFQHLYFRMEQRYYKDDTGTAMTPDNYLMSLISRGFPVKRGD